MISRVHIHVQCYPFITLCLGSIGMDHVIIELCYKGIILQKNYWNGHFPKVLFVKFHW